MRGTLLAVALVVAAIPAAADEGMWMLHELADLDRARLEAMGLALEPDQIWDPASASGLASAACSIGGCSASFVSPDGLIATNHHCAYRAIQLNSTAERDLLRDGFVARDRGQELAAKGYRVYVFRGYRDATADVEAALTGIADPLEREQARERRAKELVAECEKEEGLRCRLASSHGGLGWYLFRTLELRDVRLVEAPPEGVGDFGGEIDNWMWPRHSGDFAFLRAYVGTDGKPADPAPGNRPYRPERWLSIATTPLGDGDFTMVLGYPGRTMRYRLAAEVEDDLERHYPRRVALYSEIIDILAEQGRKGREVEIRLAAARKGYENSLKNNQGMLAGLAQADLAGRRRAEEEELERWIAADPGRRARSGDVLGPMAALVAERRARGERDLLLDQIASGRSGSLLAAAVTLERWSFERTRVDREREEGYQDRDWRDVRVKLDRMQRDVDPDTDRAVLGHLFRRAAALPPEQRIGALDEALAATGLVGDAAVSALVERLVAGTGLGDRDRRLALLGRPHRELLAAGDAMIDFAARLRRDVVAREAADRRHRGAMLRLEPRLAEAVAARAGRPLYPDANSTLRLTYGTVKGYEPRDGVRFLPFTTLGGVVAKATGVAPFAAPPALLEAARADKGPYLDRRLGDVPACFLTDTDITGGNSGSPVLNGRGELVGLAFDGNWESMTSDYRFEPALTRTISVDIRYVLWYLASVDRARHLLAEMGVGAGSEP